MSLWVFALLFTAPGDIYRCHSDDGSFHFQGRPCEGEQLGAIRSNSSASARRLREWLRELPPTAPRRPAAGHGVAAAGSDHGRAPIELPALPTGEHLLAQCSEQFLKCADGDAATMDGCVSRIPRCPGSGSVECCAANFIGRYQTLRSNGFDRKTAVRDALLGRP